MAGPTVQAESVGVVRLECRNEAEAWQAKVLTSDGARPIAINIARLPEVLGKDEPN